MSHLTRRLKYRILLVTNALQYIKHVGMRIAITDSRKQQQQQQQQLETTT
ncbi:MAG: hypothetical protein ACI97B_001245 [Verrucomicrobiales bacterium]|jgi:hypothetical protein